MKIFHQHIHDRIGEGWPSTLDITVIGGDDRPTAERRPDQMPPNVYVTLDPTPPIPMGVHFRLSPDGARRFAEALTAAAAAAEVALT
jgi:hypothetical protein